MSSVAMKLREVLSSYPIRIGEPKKIIELMDTLQGFYEVEGDERDKRIVKSFTTAIKENVNLVKQISIRAAYDTPQVGIFSQPRYLKHSVVYRALIEK